MTGPPPPDRDQGRPQHGHGPATLSLGRALAVLVVAVVVGAVLLGVAARPPLQATSTAAGSTGGTPLGSSSTTTTTAPGSSTSTTSPGSSTSTTAPRSTTTTVARSSVKVLVANGTTTSGLAGRISSQLKSQGWATQPAANATTHVSTSTVYYAAGQQATATAVARALGLAPSKVKALTTSAPVTGTTGVDVVVVAGPDLASTSHG